MKSKYDNLISYLRHLDNAAVAFSGGVDSSFLLAVCKEVLGDKAIGITVDSPALPRRELNDAITFAEKIRVRHFVIKDNTIEENVRKNPRERCYYCKRVEFTEIINEAKRLGFTNILDGSNADDKNDYRPGMKALRECKIASPLMELGFTKEEIRNFSKQMGLPTWDKPAYACLYSRFPYGTEIRMDDLRKVELAEDFLISKGFRLCRVRFHGELARIEVDSKDRIKLLSSPLDKEIMKKFRELGFKFVSVDIIGYRTGSMN